MLEIMMKSLPSTVTCLVLFNKCCDDSIKRSWTVVCDTKVVQCNVQFTGRLSAKRVMSRVNRDLIWLYSMKNYRQALIAALTASKKARRLNP